MQNINYWLNYFGQLIFPTYKLNTEYLISIDFTDAKFSLSKRRLGERPHAGLKRGVQLEQHRLDRNTIYTLPRSARGQAERRPARRSSGRAPRAQGRPQCRCHQGTTTRRRKADHLKGLCLCRCRCVRACGVCETVS